MAASSARWSGIGGEGDARPSDEPGHRLRAGAADENGEAGRLLPRQLPQLAVLVDDLGVQQIGEHVVSGRALALGHRLVRVLEGLHHRRGRHVVGHAGIGVEVERLVDPAAEHVPVLFGHAEQRGDHIGREASAEVLHEVERALPDLGVEEARTELADVNLEAGHPTRSEGLGHQPAVAGVLGRVHEDHDLLGVRRVRSHDLEHGAVGRAERLRVAAGRVHVVEAAQRVEVALGVVVARRLVTQALPDGVRVRLVLLVDRVPGERLGVDSSHSVSFSGTNQVILTYGVVRRRRGTRPRA